jgi:hypothetical protein
MWTAIPRVREHADHSLVRRDDASADHLGEREAMSEAPNSCASAVTVVVCVAHIVD